MRSGDRSDDGVLDTFVKKSVHLGTADASRAFYRASRKLPVHIVEHDRWEGSYMLGIKLIVGALAIATTAGAAAAQTVGTPAFGEVDGAATPVVVYRWASTEIGDIDGARALLGQRIPRPSGADGVVADPSGPVDGACALLGQCGVSRPAGAVAASRLDPTAEGR